MISPEGEVYSFERIANNVIKSLQPQQPSEKDIKWEIADGTRYAVGKSYQEYLKAHYPPRKSH